MWRKRHVCATSEMRSRTRRSDAAEADSADLVLTLGPLVERLQAHTEALQAEVERLRVVARSAGRRAGGDYEEH